MRRQERRERVVGGRPPLVHHPPVRVEHGQPDGRRPPQARSTPRNRTGWTLRDLAAVAAGSFGAGEGGFGAVEDLADAHVCAYVGLWWWAHGRAATLVAGDDATGAILVPRP